MFTASYIALLIYIAILAGGIGYHIGVRRKPIQMQNHIQLDIDARFIKAYLDRQGLTVLPKGVDWTAERKS